MNGNSYWTIFSFKFHQYTKYIHIHSIPNLIQVTYIHTPIEHNFVNEDFFNVITLITAYAYRNRLKFLCIESRFLFLMAV